MRFGWANTQWRCNTQRMIWVFVPKHSSSLLVESVFYDLHLHSSRSRLQGSVKFTIYIYTRSHYRFSTATRSVVATKYNSSYIMLSLKCSLCTNVSPAHNLPLRMVKHSRGGLLANSQRLRATTGLLRQNTLRS